MPAPKSGFHVAPFAIDGVQVGFGFWETSQLSEAWLQRCSEFLDSHGPIFDAHWPSNLNMVRLRFTSSEGAALATFYVQDEIASSLLLLGGQSPEADHALTGLFVDSLRKTKLVQLAAANPDPFSAAAALKERPLMAVVTWPTSAASDQEVDMVSELALHLAGAYLCQTGPSQSLTLTAQSP